MREFVLDKINMFTNFCCLFKLFLWEYKIFIFGEIFCVLCIMSLQQGRMALPIACRLNYKSNQINQIRK